MTILNKTELLMVDTLEHEFLSSGDDSMLLMLRLAQFITCGLILVTNVPLIMFIMKQGSKTFLDWLIVIDCLLCLSNLHVIALGPRNDKIKWNGIMEHYYGNSGFCFRVFFAFFCNLTNKLLTLGIVIYRLTLVLGSSFLFSAKHIKVFEYTILLTILLTSLNLTGWAVYYREDFRPFLGEVKIDNLGSRTSQFPLTY